MLFLTLKYSDGFADVDGSSRSVGCSRVGGSSRVIVVVVVEEFNSNFVLLRVPDGPLINRPLES